MQPKDAKIGQTVTIFKRNPLWSDEDVNMLLGKTGKITSVYEIVDTFANIQLKDESTVHVKVEYLEPTPTEDQVKIGSRIKVADNKYELFDYAGATGTITKIYSNVDDRFIGLYMQPDDPELASEYAFGLYLHSLNRFTIIKEPTPEPSKIPIDMYISIRVAPDKSLRMSHTRDMTIQECRNSINTFLEFAEKGDTND